MELCCSETARPSAGHQQSCPQVMHALRANKSTIFCFFLSDNFFFSPMFSEKQARLERSCLTMSSRISLDMELTLVSVEESKTDFQFSQHLFFSFSLFQDTLEFVSKKDGKSLSPEVVFEVKRVPPLSSWNLLPGASHSSFVPCFVEF